MNAGDAKVGVNRGPGGDKSPAGGRVFIKTFGCQMNVYDSERMSEALAAHGYAEAPRIEDADLVILNTCHIREGATEKVYSELGRLRELKEAAANDGRKMTLAVAGCVAQAEGAEIIARGFDPAVVNDVINKVTFSEYKRRQAAPGLKVSPRAFGMGRQIPIAQRFRT